MQICKNAQEEEEPPPPPPPPPQPDQDDPEDESRGATCAGMVHSAHVTYVIM